MESNDTVLISFDKKLSGDEKLKESVSEVVREALEKTKSVHTVVYAAATDNDETAAIAKKYGVSQGKFYAFCESNCIERLGVRHKG